jgi:3-hydroxyacyl-[acyl-carrier-protein] dehydratase
MQHTDVIPVGHPVFPGHFPGRPIVPGALLIERVIVAAAAAYPEFQPGGLKRAKFVRVLEPGEAFTIEFPGEFSGANATGLRFRVLAAGETVAEGQLVASAPPAA